MKKELTEKGGLKVLKGELMMKRKNFKRLWTGTGKLVHEKFVGLMRLTLNFSIPAIKTALSNLLICLVGQI